MTSEELLAIIERANAATKGYWLLHDLGATLQENTDEGPHSVARLLVDRAPDADFLAHARADIDALIFEVGRLQGENAMLREVAQAVANEYAEYNCSVYTGYRCGFCHVFIGPAHEDDTRPSEDHKPECPVTKAWALVGKPSSKNAEI